MKLTEAQRWILERAVANGGKLQMATSGNRGVASRRLTVKRLGEAGLARQTDAGEWYVTRAGREALQPKGK